MAMAATPTSLYVGDLRPEIVDGQLYDAFSEFKSLTSVRICRDSTTGRSLCYGYVNFLSFQDAIQAIERKNHTLLLGKTMRVTWSHRDSDARRSGLGNVFVKNLSDTIDSGKLQEMFAKFGDITSCKVVTSEDGKSKGYGFVQFTSEDSANGAIHNLNGTHVEGRQLFVGKFVRKNDRDLPSQDVKYTNLYMKNIDPNITREVLQEKFSEFGKIVSLAIAMDESGASKGFGFVNFENSDDAKRAMEAMDGTLLGSKNLYVARAQKKVEREQYLRRLFEEKKKEKIMKYMASNVYIKNICDEVSDEELEELFSKCGTITSAKLMRDDKGISKGFGFVCFSTPNEATKAVNSFHGYMLHRKPLYVAIAQKKEERQAQLQLQYAQRMAGLVGPSNTMFPQFYFTPPPPPPGVVSPLPPHQGLVYQPFGVRLGWQGTGFTPTVAPPFLPPSSLPTLPNNVRPERPNRGRLNGPSPQQNGISMQPMPKDSTNQQRDGQVTYAAHGRRDGNKTSSVNAIVCAPEGTENLSSMLAASNPSQQKQILGERLYPLVYNRKGTRGYGYILGRSGARGYQGRSFP
ncbi:hypothetical protein RND81_01G031900 [Saponaria officinalis]|uniref:RRM domain-containing protein n=1 Tax=Saponaria officinalis TaxID=3572 RepID=A0AAW1NB67_SAPOF